METLPVLSGILEMVKSATGPIVTHKYQTTGTFVVTMRVRDNNDAFGTATIEVRVKEGTAPTAKIVIRPKDGDVTTTYEFDGTSSTDPDGTIEKYLWDFGNGNTAKGPTASFRFSNPGVFSVTLVVTDNDNLQNANRKEVTVGSFDPDKATAANSGHHCWILQALFRSAGALSRRNCCRLEHEPELSWKRKGNQYHQQSKTNH